MFGYGFRNKQTASGSSFADNPPDARPPLPREDTRCVCHCSIFLCCLTFRHFTSDDVVHTVVSTSLDSAITEESPVCPAAIPLIDCYACAGMVRYRFRHGPSVVLIWYHPSFNCIVVLTALFLSSCYWQPVTLDTPLYRPWNEKITTFAHALEVMLPPNSTLDVPVVQFVDRCWCDVTSKVFFQPFNVTQWEVDSLKFYIEDAARQQKKEIEKNTRLTTEPMVSQPTNTTQQPTEPVLLMSDVASLYNIVLDRWKLIFTPSNESLPSVAPPTSLLPSQTTPPVSEPTTIYTSVRDQKSLPWWQREYSLRPYGFDIVFEFGWNDERY